MYWQHIDWDLSFQKLGGHLLIYVWCSNLQEPANRSPCFAFLENVKGYRYGLQQSVSRYDTRFIGNENKGKLVNAQNHHSTTAVIECFENIQWYDFDLKAKLNFGGGQSKMASRVVFLCRFGIELHSFSGNLTSYKELIICMIICISWARPPELNI